MSAYADIVILLTGLEHTVRSTDPDIALRAVARLRRLAEQLETEQVAAARRAG